jgi:hypothetical protein
MTFAPDWFANASVQGGGSPELAGLPTVVTPTMLNYCYATRTPNDAFITGPSGVGYVLPGFMKRRDLREFARITEGYLCKNGTRAHGRAKAGGLCRHREAAGCLSRRVSGVSDSLE